MEKEVEYELNLKDISSKIKKNKNLFVYFALFSIVITSFFIRTANIPNLQIRDNAGNIVREFLPDIDSYIFYRYAQYIDRDGFLVANDKLRYYPDGFDTKAESPMPSYAVVYLHRLFENLFGFTIFYSSVYYTAIFGALSILMFYFMVKGIFNNKISGLISALSLAVVPAYLYRTTAGVLEKEPIASFFLFLCIYLLIRVIKKKKNIDAIACGIALGISGMSWGGFIFVVMGISAYYIAMIFLKNLEKEDYVNLLLIFFVSFLMLVSLTNRFGGVTGIIKHEYFTLFFPSVILGGIFILFSKKIEKMGLPIGFVSIIAGLLIILIAGIIIMPDFTFKFVSEIYSRVQAPMGTDRFKVSVSENQEPYFFDPYRGIDWVSSFSASSSSRIINLFPFFFLGSMLLFYDISSIFGKKRIWISLGFILCISFLVFSNFSSEQKYKNLNETFSGYWVLVLFIFVLFFIGLYLKNFKEYEKNTKLIQKEKIFLMLWFIILVIGTRGAVRVLFALTAPAMAIVGYFIVELYNMIKKKTKDAVYLSTPYMIFGFIMFFAIPLAYQMCLSIYPTYNIFYDDAMQWIKNNTDSNAVFTHWWDYGYWLQTMGERATTVDGGNYHYWRNYDNARYFMSGFNDSENMKTLEEFGYPDYLFFIDDDIGKFYQMSGIGERQTWFDVFKYSGIYENPFTEMNLSIYPKVAVYESGGALLKEDLRIGNKLLSGSNTFIMYFYVPLKNDSEGNLTLSSPLKAVLYNPLFNTIIADMNCLCEGSNCSEMNDFPGCFQVIPNGGIFIPKLARNMTFTRLYILGEEMPRFSLVYENEIPITYETLSNGYYANIKIFKINYEEAV